MGGLVLAFALHGALVTAHHAGQPPVGPYVTTCENVGYENGVLSGDCRNRDGAIVHGTLPNADQCANGVANQNGQLACANGGVTQASLRGAQGKGY